MISSTYDGALDTTKTVALLSMRVTFRSVKIRFGV